ncbi:hypothetical protein ABQG55_07180 [Aeromonas dhakensis]|uniref:hypothetical protein n=1 Tax=Aeromonas dhakensis TaxID=196024 RepID=UPI0032ECD4B8
MSDTVVVESEQASSFVELLGVPKRFAASVKKAQYTATEASDQRVMAVACALELIKSSVAAGAMLDRQLSQLSEYADQIQAALNKV